MRVKLLLIMLLLLLSFLVGCTSVVPEKDDVSTNAEGSDESISLELITQESNSTEATPTTETAPSTEETPATEESSSTEVIPSTEETPATEESSSTEVIPSTEETPTTEESPSAEEITATQEEPSTEIPDPKFPMSQFPKMEITPGWLEGALENFEQPNIAALPERDAGTIEHFFYTPFGAKGSGNYYAYGVWHVQNYGYLDYLLLLDNEHVCTVSKLNDERTGITKYIYCVFKKEIVKSDLDGSLQEFWRNVQEIYFVSKCLSSKDFARLSIGDNVTELIAIEPAILESAPVIRESICSQSFLLLLEDGLLHIETTDKIVSEDNLITYRKFHPFGEPVTVNGIEAFMAVSPVRPPLPEADAEAE